MRLDFKFSDCKFISKNSLANLRLEGDTLEAYKVQLGRIEKDYLALIISQPPCRLVGALLLAAVLLCFTGIVPLVAIPCSIWLCVSSRSFYRFLCGHLIRKLRKIEKQLNSRGGWQASFHIETQAKHISCWHRPPYHLFIEFSQLEDTGRTRIASVGSCIYASGRYPENKDSGLKAATLGELTSNRDSRLEEGSKSDTSRRMARLASLEVALSKDKSGEQSMSSSPLRSSPLDAEAVSPIDLITPREAIPSWPVSESSENDQNIRQAFHEPLSEAGSRYASPEFMLQPAINRRFFQGLQGDSNLMLRTTSLLFRDQEIELLAAPDHSVKRPRIELRDGIVTFQASMASNLSSPSLAQSLQLQPLVHLISPRIPGRRLPRSMSPIEEEQIIFTEDNNLKQFSNLSIRPDCSLRSLSENDRRLELSEGDAVISSDHLDLEEKKTRLENSRPLPFTNSPIAIAN